MRISYSGIAHKSCDARTYAIHFITLDSFAIFHPSVKISSLSSPHIEDDKMKLSMSILALGIIPVALAGGSQKSVVITYPDNTPDTVIDSAKNALTDAVCWSCSAVCSLHPARK